MYFPFVYGRQSEFLAIRALLEGDRSLDALVPLIEPVNANAAALARCLDACGSRGQAVALIMNPHRHQLAAHAAALAWRKAVAPVLAQHASILPAWRVHAGTTQHDLDEFFKLFPSRPTVVVHSSPALSDAEMKTLVARASIKFHVVSGNITSIQRGMLPKRKFVEIRDEFNKLSRNADYGKPEFFSDRYKSFPTDGVGFGDYAAIGSAFQTGGTTPAAVAIHAVYKKPATGDIWIEHFVSDDTDKAVGDVAGKFVQAAGKLVRAARKRPNEFGKNEALDAYQAHVAASTSPGLGKNKQLQIMHHVCLMLDVLSGAV